MDELLLRVWQTHIGAVHEPRAKGCSASTIGYRQERVDSTHIILGCRAMPSSADLIGSERVADTPSMTAHPLTRLGLFCETMPGGAPREHPGHWEGLGMVWPSGT